MTLLLLLCSCAPARQVVVPERHREYVHDTIFRADSVYVSHYVHERDDTIRMTDTVLKYLYRDKVVEVLKHDTVPYPVEVIREVPTPIPRAYRYCMWFAIIVLLYWLFRIAKVVYLRR